MEKKRKITTYIILILLGSLISPMILAFLREHTIGNICLKYIVIPIFSLCILYFLLKNKTNQNSKH